MTRLATEILTAAVRDLYQDGRGLSKPRIAARAGLSHPTIFHILKGDQHTTLDTWNKLHRAFPFRIPEPVFETDTGEMAVLKTIPETRQAILAQLRAPGRP